MRASGCFLIASCHDFFTDVVPDPDFCLGYACRLQFVHSYGGRVRGLDEQWTWKFVSWPCGSNVITGKWVFTHKLRADGSFDRYKARWVLRGFT
jgi:hypothetical protein